MRVLITGASGRIGSRIAEKFVQDHDVTGLDIMGGPYTTVIGSITDRQLVTHLCGRVDAVIHTAALHAPHVGILPDSDFRQTNVIGTQVLLRGSMRGSVKRFIYTSSTSLYGQAMIPQDRAVWVTEELVPKARDIYDETKLAAEEECAKAAQTGLSCISLRISRCFPESENLMAIYRLYRGVDARDVVQAHALALSSNLKGFQRFNISAATPFLPEDTRDLLSNAGSVILKYFPWVEFEFAQRGWQLPKSIDRVYAIGKAQKMLGYQPEYNFESLFNAGVA
jgi:UDP-glucose 4-epimerase